MNLIEDTGVDYLTQIIAVYQNRITVHEYQPNTTNKLGVGKPLTKESAKGIFQFIENKIVKTTYGFKELIPSNVLNFSTDTPKVIWYTKPAHKHLLFSDDLPIDSGSYPIPFLVWILSGNDLKVYATKEKPSELQTELYQAPFLNVGCDGQVCMGTAKYRSASNYYQDWIDKAEQGFFNSVFTHTNTDALLKVNIVTAMQEMYEKKLKTFDTDLLLTTNMKLKDIINS